MLADVGGLTDILKDIAAVITSLISVFLSHGLNNVIITNLFRVERKSKKKPTD